LRNKIIGDAVVTEARNNIRLEKRNERQIKVLLVLLLRERKAICI